MYGVGPIGLSTGHLTNTEQTRKFDLHSPASFSFMNSGVIFNYYFQSVIKNMSNISSICIIVKHRI